MLATKRDELWSVERGLQLCAQNVLDIATHIAASAGREVLSKSPATSGRCSGPARSR